MCFALYKNTPIAANKSTLPVENAMEMLRRDLAMTLSGSHPSPRHIRILLPDREDPFNETFAIEVTGEELRIQARCSLGAVYGLLHISKELLGVQPFWFWEQQCFAPLPSISVPAAKAAYRSGAPAIRFRGWFLNDEVLLQNWRPWEDDPDFSWKMALEALLRCGGNMVIPGTDHNSKRNRRLAAHMGLWITHHHAEPLGAEMFSRVFPNEAPSYINNKQKFVQVWTQGILSQRDYNVVWALGFRGQGDRPFWEDDAALDTPERRGALMGEVIARQHALLHQLVDRPVCCINLYGEVLELYRGGQLRLPDGVIPIWADSGYGKMVSRRQSNHNPRVPALPEKPGAHGVYYHASFYDLQASNHITRLPNPASMVCEELGKAYAAGCRDYWMINCGNVAPHSYVLDLIASLWKDPNTAAGDHRAQFVTDYYGGNQAVAQRLAEYAEHTILYGSFSDERAGEQLYHHPVRELTAAWMRGRINQSLESLWWLCGALPMGAQLARYGELVRSGIAPWVEYLARCEETGAALPQGRYRQVFRQIELQALIHASGAMGAGYFCDSFAAFEQEDMCRAFCLAWQARDQFARALQGFERAEQGVWKGYYANDCLTDVRLTVNFMENLAAWLRMLGEGANRHSWHRQYLMRDDDKGVVLVTNFQRPLGDGELAGLLWRKNFGKGVQDG